MLFSKPDYLGQGLVKKSIGFAFNNLTVTKVDVNERNLSAVKFYEKLGFETYERIEKDDQGKNYPVLRMELKSQVFHYIS